MSKGLLRHAEERLLAAGYVEGCYEPEESELICMVADPALLPAQPVSEEEEEARECRDLWTEGHGA